MANIQSLVPIFGNTNISFGSDTETAAYLHRRGGGWCDSGGWYSPPAMFAGSRGSALFVTGKGRISSFMATTEGGSYSQGAW